jgi:hypothetical protein
MGVKEQMNSILPSLIEGNVNNSLQLSVLIEYLIEKGFINKEELIGKLEAKTQVFRDKAEEMKSKPSIIVPGAQ